MTNVVDCAVTRIETVRLELMYRARFFGNLLVGADLTEADPWCSTCFYDGFTLFYNREFILSLTETELANRLRLEALQYLYDAFEEFGDYKRVKPDMADLAHAALGRTHADDENAVLEFMPVVLHAWDVSRIVPYGVSHWLEEHFDFVND